ncbi:MAG: tRNA (adenosine(37)-N6)-threonylcarbamoyltransferase complex dimerization subunit type 1 TsaB [Verrucomicrobia bacterium]|nr:tRNA (adenosine(37)-N6)-threonylcarbamoyltransferase complex dimerization subunit type 1 TsaB [Verrucomicrobiota bacterium]
MPLAYGVPAPLTLVLETSTPHASLGLADGIGGFTGTGFQSDRNHNALLFGPLAELIEGKDPEEIGLVLVGSGPGSYSGTRVGIAAAQGVAMVSGCQTVAVPSMLAVPSVEEDPGRECLAIGDARRGTYWTAWMNGTGLADDPSLTDHAGLLEILETAVARQCPVVSLEPPDRFNLPDGLAGFVRVEIPTARGLWRAWQRADAATREAWSAVPPQPIYLKPPHITAPKRPWLAPS